MMKNIFEQSRSHWVRYDHYELKTSVDGKRYITPGKSAKPDVYNPLKEVPNIVLDALNVGMLMMGRKPEAEVEKAVMEFVTRYGLLGLMTALPTTPSFMDYEAVYLPKNHFIKEESMATDKYLSLFYPFDQLDLVKKGITSTWNVSGDRTMVALTMTFMDEPMAKNNGCPDHDLHGRADGEEYELPAGICGTLRLGCPAVQGLGIHPVYLNPVLQRL